MIKGNRRSGNERRAGFSKNRIEKVASTAHKVSRLVILCLLLELLLVGYVFVTEHDGRQNVVDAARAGCEQDRQDRRAAVILNEDIVSVFNEAQKQNPNLVSPARDRILHDIQVTNSGLRFRVNIDCTKRYPQASWFP